MKKRKKKIKVCTHKLKRKPSKEPKREQGKESHQEDLMNSPLLSYILIFLPQFFLIIIIHLSSLILLWRIQECGEEGIGGMDDGTLIKNEENNSCNQDC